MNNEVLDQVDELTIYLCDYIVWSEGEEKIQLINALSELLTARSFYDGHCYGFKPRETREGEE